jgi:hypothetical protein
MAQPANNELHSSIQLLIASVNQIKTKLETVDSRLDAIATLQTQVNTLVKDTNDLKRTVNNLDQESRCKTVCIIGLTIPEADIEQFGQEKAIMKRAYDKLIKPILTAYPGAGLLCWERCCGPAGQAPAAHLHSLLYQPLSP